MKYNCLFRMFLCCTILTVLCQSAYGQQPTSQNDWQALLKVARRAYNEKDYQKALLYYQNATLHTPKNIRLTDEIAQTHYRLNQMEQAKEWYNKIPQKSANTAFNKGNVAYKQKNYKESIDWYKKALRQDPNFVEARYNLTKAMKEEKKNPPTPPQNSPTPPTQSPNQPKDKQPDTNPQGQITSGLSDKSIERLLNQLTKSEAQTKRKLNNGQPTEGSAKSEKNW